MKKSLLIDIGNSNTIWADYKSGEIGGIESLQTDLFLSNDIIGKFEDYSQVIISSVVPAIDAVIEKKENGPFFITNKTIPSITVDLDTPNEVGSDRIVNALAAHNLYQRGCLVIDSGTALTFCYLSKEGVYKGGIIFPGMRISSQALTHFTAKIPEIYVSPNNALYGRTTKEAVQIGLYKGYIHLINGFISDYRTEFPESVIVGTGNGLNVVKDHIDLDHFDEYLILKGLAICADAQLIKRQES